MRFDNLLHDRKTQAHAALLFRVGFQLLKNLAQPVGRYSDSCIFDPASNDAIYFFSANRDFTVRGVFNRV